SPSSPGGGGPFAKGDDTIYVGQAYAGFKGFPDFTFTGGRMPKPPVTTLIVWGPDIKPKGFAEKRKDTFTFTFCGGGGGGSILQQRRLQQGGQGRRSSAGQ